MQGTIRSYRRSYRTENIHQCIVSFEDVKTRAKAQSMLGKKVAYYAKGGKCICGKISGVHGNAGFVIARFAKAVPGQALGRPLMIQQELKKKKASA